jgi:hypothetical protein
VLAGAIAGAPEGPELVAAREAVRGALQRLLDAGVRAGAVRADATADDLKVHFSGVARVLHERGERDPAVWRRHARMVAAALRA